MYYMYHTRGFRDSAILCLSKQQVVLITMTHLLRWKAITFVTSPIGKVYMLSGVLESSLVGTV